MWIRSTTLLAAHTLFYYGKRWATTLVACIKLLSVEHTTQDFSSSHGSLLLIVYIPIQSSKQKKFILKPVKQTFNRYSQKRSWGGEGDITIWPKDQPVAHSTKIFPPATPPPPGRGGPNSSSQLPNIGFSGNVFFLIEIWSSELRLIMS